MYIAHLDCSSGISGDKFLGALLDAGAASKSFTLENLKAMALALGLECKIESHKESSHGIAAVGIKVTNTSEAPTSRSFASIRDAIEDSALPSPVKEKAITIFTRLAEAEGLIHSVPPEEVHFHELGADDTIVDIVGTCLGLYKLGVDELYATPPALGSGTVNTAHGELPVPAPATSLLLLGKPTSLSSASGELTTPTGAALLHLAKGFGPVPAMTPELLGFGMGTKDIGQPNIARILVGEAITAHLTLKPEETVLLETNIDHIAPEAVAFAGEELLAEGALDVWITPISMKKSRAALMLSLLAKKEDANKLAERVVALTGSLGVRVCNQPRLSAKRDFVELETPWGPVTLKRAAMRLRAEYEDVARIAREHNLEYQEVLDTITKLSEKL